MTAEMTTIVALVKDGMMQKALAAENMETAIERMTNHLLIDYAEQSHVINSGLGTFMENNGLELYAEYTDHENPLSLRWVGILEHEDDFMMFGAATDTEYWNYVDHFLQEAWEDYDANMSPEENKLAFEDTVKKPILKIHAV